MTLIGPTKWNGHGIHGPPHHHRLMFCLVATANENVSRPFFRLRWFTEARVGGGGKQRKSGVWWLGLPWIPWPSPVERKGPLLRANKPVATDNPYCSGSVANIFSTSTPWRRSPRHFHKKTRLAKPITKSQMGVE